MQRGNEIEEIRLPRIEGDVENADICVNPNLLNNKKYKSWAGDICAVLVGIGLGLLVWVTVYMTANAVVKLGNNHHFENSNYLNNATSNFAFNISNDPNVSS